jgi:hypothetical protein
MKTIAISSTVKAFREVNEETTYRRLHRRWMTGLLVSSIAAGVTGVFGVALAVLSLIHVISTMGRLGLTGTVLLAATFPLVVFAAHCLDRVDDENRTYRMASYKRKILGDADDWNGQNRR